MRKSIIAVLSVFICFVALLICVFFIYDTVLPIAEPIRSPHPDTVLAFNVISNDNVEIENADFYTFYDFLLNAQPTRIMSVNDYPDTIPYFEVNILASDNRFYRYFLYSSNGKHYVEIPYFGVYMLQNYKIDDLFK